MTRPGRLRMIVNPAAGRGCGARRLPQVRAAFAGLDPGEPLLTSRPGEEEELARRALQEGATTLVVVGGDGTWGNAAHAIVEAGADCRLVPVAAGTGNDFAKTLGLPATDPAAMARLAGDGAAMRVDVGRIEGRHFLNVAGFGLDIAVIEDVGRLPLLSGAALYYVSALRQLLGYRGIEIDVGTAAGARGPRRHLMLIVANARQFGGAFRIAPQARLDDGLLDAVAFLDAPPLRRFALFDALLKGTHGGLAGVSCEQAARFTLRFTRPPAYETDGEYRRAASATLEVSCLPRALRVVVAGPQAGA